MMIRYFTSVDLPLTCGWLHERCLDVRPGVALKEYGVKQLGRICALVLVAIAMAMPAGRAWAEPNVSALRLGQNSDRTRFVIDIDNKVEPTIFTLADPERLVVDLPKVTFTFEGQGVGDGRGLISRYRYGLFDPGTSRIVLDLEQAAKVDRFFVLPPQGPHRFRLVFDLVPTSRKGFLAGVKRPQPMRDAPASAVVKAKPPEPPRHDTERIVVLDAGHGGNDPGAPGVNGVPEKSITLAVAREAYALLKASGRYRPLLTRNRDVYIKLRDRVDFARANHADLFVSLHADSLGNRRVRGATVYTLSENASDAEAAALAERENRADVVAGVNLAREAPEVADILIDLAMRETMNYSARFANYLIPELDQRVTLRRNSHRFAGFVVLKAPDVPSILLEMGYMSNPQDAAILSSRPGQKRIAQALLRAVDRYFETVEQARY